MMLRRLFALLLAAAFVAEMAVHAGQTGAAAATMTVAENDEAMTDGDCSAMCVATGCAILAVLPTAIAAASADFDDRPGDAVVDRSTPPDPSPPRPEIQA